MIKYLDSDSWFLNAACIIQDAVDCVLRTQGYCSVMLTGGKSAQGVYLEWRNLQFFQELSNTSFYFGDERCVPQDDPENNFSMVKNSLFLDDRILLKNKIYPMNSNVENSREFAIKYSRVIPNKIDILLLTVGDDGHIASLFPYSNALLEDNKKIIPVVGKKAPYHRLTITPPVILNASSVFVLCKGPEKHQIYEIAIKEPADFLGVPARLVLNRNWLL